MKKGVSRGIFSNEAGLGTGSIAHACADTRKPVKQGFFGIFEVFADTKNKSKKKEGFTMFGSKEASEDKLKKMVEKGKWDKLRKQYLDSDKTTQVALAKACAASRNDGSVNILTSLLEVDDVDVKIAAVTSLGEVGDDHVTALIRQLAVKTPADQTELKAAITKALEKIVERA